MRVHTTCGSPGGRREKMRNLCQWHCYFQNPQSSEFQRGLKERLGLARTVPYLVASLSLSNENEGIGAYDGEAEVDEDDGALGADVPGVLKKGEERNAFRDE